MTPSPEYSDAKIWGLVTRDIELRRPLAPYETSGLDRVAAMALQRDETLIAFKVGQELGRREMRDQVDKWHPPDEP